MSAFSKWEWRACNGHDVHGRTVRGLNYIARLTCELYQRMSVAGLPVSIHRPSDSDSRYLMVNGYTVRISDHEPVTILGVRRGGFDSKRGCRHAPADFYFHPGSRERIAAVIAAVAESAAAKHSKAPLCGAI